MDLILQKFGEKGLAQWQAFVSHEKLTEKQEQLFEKYVALLCDWNEDINLTRIIDLPDIIAFHFQDSLRIADFIDFSTVSGMCDVGSGGGFPGIPLKIMYPSLPVVLLEVCGKKINFLNTVIQDLGLENIEVCGLDWRTFLRKAPYENLSLFLARASLRPDELMRMFKPSCAYKSGEFVYWASKHWKPESQEIPLIVRREGYTVDSKQRDYVFFKAKNS